MGWRRNRPLSDQRLETVKIKLGKWPVQDADGWWVAAAPPSEHAELVIRIAPLGQQRIATARWAYDLLPRFGETVVTVRVQRLGLWQELALTLASR